MSKENNTNNNVDEKTCKDEEFVKKYIINYSNQSLKLEEQRENLIYKSANSMLTCISILLASTSTIIFQLIDRLKGMEDLIIIFSIFLIGSLLIGIVFLILANSFYKRDYLATGKELLKHVNKNLKDYMNVGFLDQQIEDNDSMINTLRKNNNKRRNFVIYATRCLYFYLIIILVFTVVILVIK